ncbi:hypothetical protein EXS74_02465 [Candidatus Woesearchaeota archaeon]|nr:hypothetical protein [Candidatus Woesearchaeota archaeon]
MEKPKFLIARYFINNPLTKEWLPEGIDNLIKAGEILERLEPMYTMGLKLTVNNLDEDSEEAIKKQVSRLPLSFWYMFDPVDRGPGMSAKQVQLNHTFDDGILVNVDLDQFVINTEEGVGSIIGLVESLERENCLYALGSRDVPIRLAKYPSNSVLREIHELYHSLTIGSEHLHIEDSPQGISPGYRTIGESTPAMTVVNHTHRAYPTLVHRVAVASQQANFRGWTAEYYMSIVASELDRIKKGYVKTKTNPFLRDIEENRERDWVLQMIEEASRELGKTDVGKKVHNAVINKENYLLLERFYDPSDISIVQSYMKKGLETTVR